MSGSTATSSYANTTNLLVPPNAATHCVKTGFTATASPFLIDFQAFSLNNYPFNPQGVYADNTAGSGPLTLTVQGLGFTMTIPAGQMVPFNFPSPQNVVISAVGLGNVNLYWTDYPLVNANGSGGSSVFVTGGEIGISGTTPVDASVESTVANTSEPLLPANANRKYIMIQAPQTAGLWLNFAGGTAGPDLSGCIFLPQGNAYESTNIVNLNAINYFCSTANLVIAVLEG
jgi:hypothetical protein